MAAGAPAAGFNFNTFKEIKSHSSILYNERMAILFYLLDMKSIQLNTSYQISDMLEVRATLKQIYKNIRMLIRNTPTVRATLNLDTKDEGIYITDLAFGIIDRLIEHCESFGYTTKKIYVITQELNNVETVIKDILQYFHYFIRPDFHQKPDIDMATEQYKMVADKHTVEELRAIVGKRHKIDFGNLGLNKIEMKEEVDYDPTVDDDESEVKEEEDED